MGFRLRPQFRRLPAGECISGFSSWTRTRAPRRRSFASSCLSATRTWPRTSVTQALEALSGKPFDLCVVSLGLPARVPSATFWPPRTRARTRSRSWRASRSATVREIVSAFRMGALDFLPRPFHDQLCSEVIERALSERNRASSPLRTSGVTLVGDHPAMHVVLERVDQVADSNASVLIRGEEGTGKEVVARLIHACGARRGGPFVTVRLAGGEAHPTSSELFGSLSRRTMDSRAGPEQAGAGRARHPVHRRNREPFARAANWASAPGARSGSAQPRRRAHRRGHRAQPGTAVREGTFIEDLYYRLNIIPIEIPPLRERLEDIPILAEHFRRAANAFHGAKHAALSARPAGAPRASAPGRATCASSRTSWIAW
jgi:DNA-binding NtrC family response regulator